jgi:ABC-2 type transport system ATP-binding protein
MALIEAQNLTKTFRRTERGAGLRGAVAALFSRRYTKVVAVDHVTFQVGDGEIVGYVGPNGAGKSTTVKMLTGVLVPTSGQVTVAGRIPHRQRVQNARQMGVVFGQRTQLWWDIPVRESLSLLRDIYQVPQRVYHDNLALFSEVLGLDELLPVPARKLSLGQRMRCDLAAALLHNPRLVYLDEPTIGLDITVKERVRKFIKTINRERRTTILLTTHDLQDIQELCSRILIIDHGRIIYDGSVEALKARYGHHRVLVCEVRGPLPPVEQAQALFPNGEAERDALNHRLRIRFARQRATAASVAARVMEALAVQDLTVEEPGIESVIKWIYESGAV